jgi:hypothetical protein
MTYKINITTGDLLAEVPDGTFDTSATSITLIGKNVVNFGEAINENFVKLLENFASTSEPQQAIRGQLWYDTASGRLNIYDGTQFRTSGGPLISNSEPLNPVTGDLWINNESLQLFFYDGTSWTLAGPAYTETQGLSGFIVDTIPDIFSRSRTITKLFVGGTLLGVFSKETFTPKDPIAGYGPPGTVVNVGFNASNFPDIKFNVTVTRAESILLDDGITPKTASEIAFTSEENVFAETITIQNNAGMVIGGTEQVQIYIDRDDFLIEHRIQDQDLRFRVKTGPNPVQDAITVKGSTERVGIFNSNPQYTLDVDGSLRITGDLIVSGDTVSIDVQDISVEDKNIVLGKVPAPETATDLTADQGGLILKGDTDHSILYSRIDGNWDFTENLNIPTGKVFKINNIPILSATTLGSSVVSSNLTSVGNLISLQMNSGLNITGNSISSTGNITINPASTIDVSTSKIINLVDPTDVQDAATKKYVDDSIFDRPIGYSMMINKPGGGVYSNTEIAAILDKIFPYYNPTLAPDGTAIVGTILRLHAVQLGIVNSTVPVNSATNIDRTFITVDKAGVFENAQVLQDIAITPLSAPTATINITPSNRKFIMVAVIDPLTGNEIGGNWQFDELIP